MDPIVRANKRASVSFSLLLLLFFLRSLKKISESTSSIAIASQSDLLRSRPGDAPGVHAQAAIGHPKNLSQLAVFAPSGAPKKIVPFGSCLALKHLSAGYTGRGVPCWL